MMCLAAAIAALLIPTASWVAHAHRSETSWSLVVLFDVSASMRLGPREADALLGAVHDGMFARLAPGDRVRIAAFASEIRLSSLDGSGDDAMDVLRDALTGEPEWRYGPSRLWDAVDTASAAIANDPGQRVVVVVSDGEASGNELSRAEVAANLRARAVDLWVIHVVNSWGDPSLRTFATSVGGRVFDGNPRRKPDPKRSALGGALAEVLEAIRALARERTPSVFPYMENARRMYANPFLAAYI
jgi:hypothetical protein